jgi:hypothetical protein
MPPDCASYNIPRKSDRVSLALVSCLTVFLLFSLGCSDEPVIPNSGNPVSTFQPAPLNPNNPYDSVGYFHNAILMYALDPADLDTADLADESTLLAAARNLVIGLQSVDVSAWDAGVDFIAQNPNVDWAQYAMTLGPPDFTAKEAYYINRIGYVLANISDSSEIKDSLIQIETDIVNDSWPVDLNVEAGARIAISVAKHSYHWWLWVLDGNRHGAFSKIQGPWKEIAAADHAAAVNNALVQVITTGRVDWRIVGAHAAGASTAAAIKAYWDEIEGFFGWCWEGIKWIGSKIGL